MIEAHKQIFCIFARKCYELILTLNGLGYILGNIFKNSSGRHGGKVLLKMSQHFCKSLDALTSTLLFCGKAKQRKLMHAKKDNNSCILWLENLHKFKAFKMSSKKWEMSAESIRNVFFILNVDI
jgi:hypothetical protein